MTKKEFLLYLLGFMFCLPSSTSVKITSLDVPKTAWDAVKLNCKYDLEGATLYAVKWYKDGSEFFRCSANGSVYQFPMKDISIYHTGRSQIGSCFFELTALTSKSGGEYMCEVGLEWPTFTLVRQSTHLEVIEPSSVVQPDSNLHAEDGESLEPGTIKSGASFPRWSRILLSVLIIMQYAFYK